MNTLAKTTGVGVIAVALLATGCGSTKQTPQITSCPVGQVLEIDNDGAECEPDVNRNGIDDEDDRARGIVVIPVPTRPASTPSKPKPSVSPAPTRKPPKSTKSRRP